MAQAPPPANSDSNDPYERLGLKPGASFEAVQNAKVARLAELPADDMKARAQVEAAYDAVLMQSLKERQLGQLTGAAATASKQEAGGSSSGPLSGGNLPRLPSLPAMPKPQLSIAMPELNLAEGEQLWQPLAAQGLLLVALLLVGQQAGTPELLLSLSRTDHHRQPAAPQPQIFPWCWPHGLGADRWHLAGRACQQWLSWIWFANYRSSIGGLAHLDPAGRSLSVG